MIPKKLFKAIFFLLSFVILSESTFITKGRRKSMDADFLLIHRMKNGDDRAIDSFVKKYYPVILRYCRLHTKDTGYAEDLTQETFARFFRTLQQYQHYGKAANYLYVVASNLCKDSYKRKEEMRLEELPEPVSEEMAQVDLRIHVHMAVQKLPQELRDVTVLYFFQEVNQREIAKILQIGLPLVKYRIKRAKELLSGYLGEEEMK